MNLPLINQLSIRVGPCTNAEWEMLACSFAKSGQKKEAPTEVGA
ncbi:hypothetical protein [Devosia sp. YR412]|nr:hypothetical protein [Devosia sp. YR412]